MPTNASSATATTANGSKEVGQPINSSTIKTSLLPGEKETFITPKVRNKISSWSVVLEKNNLLDKHKFHWNNLFESKVPLPDPKGNPDSDDESIMRKVLSQQITSNFNNSTLNHHCFNNVWSIDTK